MLHETSKENEIIISNTTENFETWISRCYISEELKKELKKADVLIVPTEGYINEDIIAFPTETESIFQYIKEKLPQYTTDICIEENDYKELALHSDLYILGSFVVSTIVSKPYFSIYI